MEAYRATLLEVLEERRLRNPAYSLRAFASSCGVSPASLSQILSGKRPFTVKSAKRIAERLALTPLQGDRLIGSAQARVRTSAEARELGRRDELDLDRYRLVADWYHYAILSLCELPDQSSSPEWIASRLGIAKSTAKEATDRLVTLGLLKVEARGKMRQVTHPLVTTNDVPSAALRRHSRQCLDRAAAALESVSIEWREFGTMTMAIDPRRLPQAKRLIRKFRQQLAAICETGDQTIVYQFATQLFPVGPVENFFDPKEYENDVKKTR